MTDDEIVAHRALIMTSCAGRVLFGVDMWESTATFKEITAAALYFSIDIIIERGEIRYIFTDGSKLVYRKVSENKEEMFALLKGE